MRGGSTSAKSCGGGTSAHRLDQPDDLAFLGIAGRPGDRRRALATEPG
jgi:hypothetical protein